MSFQVDNLCFDSKLSAMTMIAQKANGSLHSSGGVISIGSINENSVVYRINTESSFSTIEVPYLIPDCQLLNYQDALNLAWPIAVVWLSVWAVIFIARTIRNFDGEQNDS